MTTGSFTLLGCTKLLSSLHDGEPDAAADAGAAAATTPAETAPPTAQTAPAASATAKPAARSTASVGATKAMAAPAATVDRVLRNRLKDGPCPAGFTEQPGVEEHSSCARVCKVEPDCHGHTCVDSDVGSGKVCSLEASKPLAGARASASAPASASKPPAKCKATETDVSGQCMKSCVSDKDCAGKKCVSTSFNDPGAGQVSVMVCN